MSKHNVVVLTGREKICDNSLNYLISWAHGELNTWTPSNNILKILTYPPVEKPLDFIVYNQDSVVDHSLRIREHDKCPSIIFVQSGENDGFAAGNNIGLRYAFNQNDFEYAWFLNNDTVIQNNALSELVKGIHMNSEIGAVGSKVLYFDNPNLL